jgi:hypothetical protein
METAAARTMEGQIRRMTPAAAPPDLGTESFAATPIRHGPSNVIKHCGLEDRDVTSHEDTKEQFLYETKRVVDASRTRCESS